MPNLLYCCLPMKEERFYFIINTIDLVLFTINVLKCISILFKGAISAQFGGTFILSFISLILAGASMYIYMTKKSYQSHAHVAYFYFQLFEAIIGLIILSFFLIILIAAGINMNNKETGAIAIVGLIFCLVIFPPALLNLYWRKTLVKMLDN